MTCDSKGNCIDQFHDGCREEGFQIHGLKEGAWLFYDEAGTLRRVIHYRDGFADGLYTVWDANGVRRGEGCMAHVPELGGSSQVGEWTYWDENGRLLESRVFDPITPSGLWMSQASIAPGLWR